jgi:hypothetical protein
MAQLVEEKKQRGEPMGPPPARTMVAKRRYDATPSSATQRPLAPIVDGMDIDNVSPSLRPTQAQHSPPSLPVTQPKLHPLAAQSGPSSLASAAPGEIRPKTQQPRFPRVGFFTEERKDAATVPQLTLSQQQTQQQLQQPMQMQPQIGQNQALLQRAETIHTSTWRGAPEQVPPKMPQMQSTVQQQALSLHQSSAPTPRQYLSAHGNMTDIVDGHRQQIFKREDENPSLRRIEQYGNHAREFGAPVQDKILSPIENPYVSPTKEVPRPNSTPAQMPEAPRPALVPTQALAPSPAPVPAPAPTKRINIMSMLNDDTETQPTKRLKEAHDESSKTQSPASTYQPASQPLSRVDSQSHAPTPVHAPTQQYTQHGQYPGLQHQPPPVQQAAAPPTSSLQRSAGPYQETSNRWPSHSQPTPHSEWLKHFDPRPTNRSSSAYSPQQTTNSPPVHAAYAPGSSSIPRHSQQPYQHTQHAPSPPPQPAHQTHFRSGSQQQHVRIPSYGHVPSPTIGPQHQSHTGPPPIPALQRHPYAAPSPPPQAPAHGPPPQQPHHGSREYLPTHMYPPPHATGSQPPRDIDIRAQHEQQILSIEHARRQPERQPPRIYTPRSGPWNTYSDGGGASGGSGEKPEIY